VVFIGQLQEQKGQLDQAIASFDKARQLAPKDGLVVAHCGLALMQAGRTQEGIAALRESVKLQPDMPVLMNNLAWHLAEVGANLDEAQALAQHAVQIDPSNSAFSDTLGVVYLKAGKSDNALQVLQVLVRKEPNSPTYRVHLARALIGLGQQQKARTELDVATRNHPSPAESEEIQKLLASLAK
jgi:Flp pilus assembly protein TadD